jgi:hypothetical protein
MKRQTLLFLVSALVVGSASLTACGGDDDSGSGGKGKGGTGAKGGTGGTGAKGGTGGTVSGGTGGTISGGTGGTGGTVSGGTGGNTGGTGGVAGGDGGTIPTPPTLGAQIDRMGRPAINTALNKTFELVAATKQAGKDAYNVDNDPTKWATAYASEFAGNLAVLDGLDTVCGNQILYSAEAAGPYNGLAAVLTGDWLLMDTTKTTCSYLGVEAPIVGLGAGNCGGRPLDNDVIDASYSALAAGKAGFDSAGKPLVGDGVPAPDKTFGTTFPYLAAPW